MSHQWHQPVWHHLRHSPSIAAVSGSLCLLFLCASVTLVDAALSNAERLSKLEHARASSRDGILTLSATQLRKYVEPATRAYSLFVMFSADASMCQPCAGMQKDLSRISAELRRTSTRWPVHVAVVMLSMEDQAFLTDYGLQHVPMLYHFPPAEKKEFPRHISPQERDNFDVETLGGGANAMKLFFNSRAGTKMQVRRTGYDIPYKSVVAPFLPLIAFLAAIFMGVAVYLGLHVNPMFWFVCSMIVYMYSVVGGHFVWIHNSPFATVNHSGNVEYLAHGSRSQTAAESIFVSVVCIGIASNIILINELPRLVRNKSVQTPLGLLLFGIIVTSVSALLLVYFQKMPSYLLYAE